MTSRRDDEFMERIADSVELTQSERAPADLKARLYSTLVRRQVDTGPLMSASMNNFGMVLVDIQRAYESTTSTTSLGSPAIGNSRVQASIGNREGPGILQ